MTQKEREQAEASHAKYMRDLEKKIEQSKQDEVIREIDAKHHSENYRNPLATTNISGSIDETMLNYG
ncbi:MAG: hypothetical protein U9N34_01545 [Candidatus Cloacimonadota bacterium]|nr:hypothetical protein [Candidatus Cloacimonadota bacterium]